MLAPQKRGITQIASEARQALPRTDTIAIGRLSEMETFYDVAIKSNERALAELKRKKGTATGEEG
jgi:hypothetical protein